MPGRFVPEPPPLCHDASGNLARMGRFNELLGFLNQLFGAFEGKLLVSLSGGDIGSLGGNL